ncbi:MAG: uroporphyrinogen-III synthase [Bacteroidetes bacterium]|nr:uroporphyrinogen-III synthase [Bacteroidota bacterium]
MMLVKEKKVTKKQIKRERILDAAAELFSQKSYHEVMMEDVAKMIGVAKGTVYNYFTSKEELYFSIMSLRMENLLNSLAEKIRSEHNSIDSLRTFILHVYMFMMKYQNFFLMYKKESLNSESNLCNKLRNLEDQLKEQLAGIIRNGIKDNLFREVDDEFTANSILGSIYGTVQRDIDRLINREQKIIERERLFEFIIHALYSGFKNHVVLPLKNKNIVLTRTIEQSKESASKLTRFGANVIVFPTLEIVPPSSWDSFDSVVINPDKIDFIIFTSAHAVEMFSLRCRELNVDINFEKINVVAVGNKTSAICNRYDIPVSIVPEKFSSEGVIEKLSKFNLKDKFVFIPRSAIGREELPRGLKDLGAIIKSVPVYNVSLPTKEHLKSNLEKLKYSNPDLFIFTSPSTFENFLQILNVINPAEYFNKYDVAAIGPTTKATIENRRVKVNIMPDEYTTDGLIKKIIGYYNS